MDVVKTLQEEYSVTLTFRLDDTNQDLMRAVLGGDLGWLWWEMLKLYRPGWIWR